MQTCLKLSSTYISPLHSLALRGFFLLLLNSVVIQFGGMSLNVSEDKSNCFCGYYLSLENIAQENAP
jgi:hypothetical protein